MKQIKLILKYFNFYKNYIGNRIFFIFLFSTVTGFSEGVGIILLLPIFISYLEKDLFALDNLNHMKIFFDFFHLDFKFETILAIGASLVLAKAILIFSVQSYIAYLKGVFLLELKTELVHYFTNLRFNYYLKKTTGHFINVANEQANRASGGFLASIGFFVNLTMSLAYTALALLIDWKFSVFVFGSGFIIFSFLRYVNHFTIRQSKDITFFSGIIGNYFIELLESYKYLSATSQRSKFMAASLNIIKKFSKAHFYLGLAGAFIYAIREPLILILIVVSAAIQINYFNTAVSDIMISTFLIYRAVNGIMSIQMNIQAIFEASGSIEAVSKEIIELENNQEYSFGSHFVSLNKNLDIKELTFSHTKLLKPALNKITIDVKSGEAIAIVGASGAGKTSLIDIICFLQTPDTGLFRIDGVPFLECDANIWREQIGYVPQDASMFDGSIIENITMDRYNTIPCQKILNLGILAAKKAYIHDFIKTLPEGYFTKIGEGGHRLSGGQKQRLVIARELYREPKLLILDEATSALDAESELAIKKSIDLLKGKVTIIMIAHRLSSIKNVDQVFVMENGSILEKGTYKTLSSREDTRLSELIKSQKL